MVKEIARLCCLILTMLLISSSLNKMNCNKGDKLESLTYENKNIFLFLDNIELEENRIIMNR